VAPLRCKRPVAKPPPGTAPQALLPVPLRPPACGLPPTLSVRVRLAVRVTVASGGAVTPRVRERPAAGVLAVVRHVLVWLKSPALVPLIPIVLMVRSAVPLFLRVTV